MSEWRGVRETRWNRADSKLRNSRRANESAARHAMARSAVQALEIANQQQAEVAPRRQARPALVGDEALAETFDVPVELVLVEDLIQNGCAALRGRSWVATHIDGCFACRFRLPNAIGHSVVRGIDRVDPNSEFHHGRLGLFTFTDGLVRR